MDTYCNDISDRIRVQRAPKRGVYDRDVIEAILDEALVCHLGFVHDGHPFVIPTLHARVGDTVYVHGSAASRMLRTLAGGAPVCLTVTLVDGLVLARSAFHHSVNYRSAVVLGEARLIDDPGEKTAALRGFTEQIVPGRWPDVRPPTAQELKATWVLALPLREASVKMRTGAPVDDEADYALDIWAGVIPLSRQALAPDDDPRLAPGISAPLYARNYSRPLKEGTSGASG
jgi:nitroimidazol reductase NimA-like FMN-containing flavoprotein (pyridoxamine 5'-phosphate oxidase superfamily)